MVYKVDNRKNRHKGRNVGLAIIIPLIAIGMFFAPQIVGSISKTANSLVPNVSSTQETQNVDWDAIALQIHDLVNKEREANHVSDLTWDGSIASVALAHSKDMIQNNYVGHIDLQGNNPIIRVEQAGINCNGYTGENIETLYGYSYTEVSQNTISDWINDPAHKANLLSSGYTREGIGISHNGDRTSVTEDFC